MRRLRLIAAAFVLLTIAVPVALADNYQPWQNPNNPTQPGDLQQLVKQLRQLIWKAEKAKAADPNFLKDLKSLADSYDNPWPVQVFFDDFRDGDYLSNPPWRVSAGRWRIVDQPLHGLQTGVAVQQSSNTYGNNQDSVVGILGALLQPGGQNQNQQQNQYAGISASVPISNAFNLHFELTAGQDNQRLDLGFYRGNNDGGYFLTYTPLEQNGLTLSRVVPGQANQAIDTSGPLNLGGDRKLHAIDWKRARDGRMTVAVDGTVMVDATDTTLQRSFDGFAIGNSGGWYIIHSVTISGQPPH